MNFHKTLREIWSLLCEFTETGQKEPGNTTVFYYSLNNESVIAFHCEAMVSLASKDLKIIVVYITAGLAYMDLNEPCGDKLVSVWVRKIKKH